MGVGDNAAWLDGSQTEALAAEWCGNGSRDVGVIADDLEALADAGGGLLESLAGREAALWEAISGVGIQPTPASVGGASQAGRSGDTCPRLGRRRGGRARVR